MNNRALLLVLDGFGIGHDSPYNAIKNARMPFYKQISEHSAHSKLITHGLAVGLPKGVMGNSEVGHMTLGAGRVIYQDLTRISKAIEDRSFFQNPILKQTLEAGAKKTGRVHLMGLLSDGGVHSHIDHLLALLDFCVQLEVPHVSVHCFLDGRDTPPDTSPQYLSKLLKHAVFSKKEGIKTQGVIASIMGRYWVMDRDKRWERVEKAYMALTGQSAPAATPDPLQIVQASYAAGKSDEFVEPTLLVPSAAMKDGDSVVFFNYRSDRAREITQAMTDPDFQEFKRKTEFHPSSFAGMTQYDLTFKHVAVAFGPQSLDHIFGEWLEEHHLKQLRIAETEKYAHVTFFFNGGREKPFEGEERILIPSPKEVATYDLKPEMSAFQVAEVAAKQIETQKFDFILMNFANADMIGHTGNYEAAVQSLEALDKCLAQVIGAAQKNHYHVLLTADHGNAEELRDEKNRIHTQHTLNPVPLIWIPPSSEGLPPLLPRLLKDGGLADIMPTLCDLMNLPIPPEVTGKSLLSENRPC